MRPAGCPSTGATDPGPDREQDQTLLKELLPTGASRSAPATARTDGTQQLAVAVSATWAQHGGMRLEIVVIPDCPHESAAVDLLRTALDDIGLSRLHPVVRVIPHPAAAADERYDGSPTFAAEGQDLFPLPNSPAAFACRLYNGPGGLPPLRELRQALKQAAALTATR